MNVRFVWKIALAFLVVGVWTTAHAAEKAVPAHSEAFKPHGTYFLKADGKPRTVAILLFNGMTSQDFIGVYSVLNFASGDDLQFEFVAKEKGPIVDDRGRLTVIANRSIKDINKADILIIPGGSHFGVLADPESLAWVKSVYDSSEYTVSVCTGAHILGAAGATTGKQAGIAWLGRDLLPLVGMKYVPTPPVSIDGKYYSAAGAAGGIEAGLLLVEALTGSKKLSQATEFAAEWNPHMLYGSGDPQKVSPEVLKFFYQLIQTDPLFKGIPLPR